MPTERLDAQREAAETLRQVLALVESGEMTASAAFRRRVEGAVTAFEAAADG